jgi:transketolase
VPIEFIGLQDTFGESGAPEALPEKYGLTGPFIADAARRVCRRKAG